MVLISFVLNIFITWLVFLFGGQIIKFMGRGGLKAVSRVFSLLLAAIAISMIIRGLNLIGLLDVAG
jgi:multiple antibiotic resistance protein